MSGVIVPPRKEKSTTPLMEDIGETQEMVSYPAVGEDTLLAMVEVCKTVAQGLDDETAVQAKALYADWEDTIGQTVEKGYKFRHSRRLYKTVQETTEITADNIPGEGTEDIYEDIG